MSAAATPTVQPAAEVEKKEEPWKRYYEAHRDQVLAIQKEKKRWLTYYERHQDDVRERNRQRYYAKAGREAPPRKERKKKTEETPNEPEIDRLAELLAEMRTLIPSVMKPLKEPKKPSVAAAPAMNEVIIPDPKV